MRYTVRHSGAGSGRAHSRTSTKAPRERSPIPRPDSRMSSVRPVRTYGAACLAHSPRTWPVGVTAPWRPLILASLPAPWTLPAHRGRRVAALTLPPKWFVYLSLLLFIVYRLFMLFLCSLSDGRPPPTRTAVPQSIRTEPLRGTTMNPFRVNRWRITAAMSPGIPPRRCGVHSSLGRHP